MQLDHRTVRLKTFLGLILAGVLLSACRKQNETPVPEVKTEVEDTLVSVQPTDVVPDTSTDSVSEVVPEKVTEPDTKPVAPIHFSSRPILQAFPGRLYQYHPVLSKQTVYKLYLLKGPDSMAIVNGQVVWNPKQAGQYAVTLEADLEAPESAGKVGGNVQQSFLITVDKVLALDVKPLPAEVNKGDTVTFDLRGSTFPDWAGNEIKVRFDYEGDGTWDTEALPLMANLIHRQPFEKTGRFTPKIEAQYKDLETRTATAGVIAVSSAVDAVLKIVPDTVEPGGKLQVDASGSKGDGRLVYIVDLNADGKPDWVDSLTGKAELKAPGSGVYQSALIARNLMGQEGKASVTLRVNAKSTLEFKAKNPKANMAAEVEFRAHAMDADDNLSQARINFTGDPKDWVVRTTPLDSVISPKDWLMRFRHAYGKVGKYSASLCVTSADGRESCKQIPIEIFNALPECQLGADLHATLVKPMDIEGAGIDPDGKIVKWEWDLNNDGKFDLVSATDGKFKYTFSKLGIFPLVLRITTADGVQATGTRKVEVRKKWKGK